MVVRVAIGRAWQRCAALGFLIVAILAAGSSRALAQAWPSYAHDAQHTCRVEICFDDSPDHSLANPGRSGPAVFGQRRSASRTMARRLSRRPTLSWFRSRPAATGGFRLEAHQGSNGSLFWIDQL